MHLQSQALRVVVKQDGSGPRPVLPPKNRRITLARRPLPTKERVTAMNRAFVLDKNRQPLMPCPMHRAKELLGKGRAAVYRREPFTSLCASRMEEIYAPSSYFRER
jgi:hypothetical protein